MDKLTSNPMICGKTPFAVTGCPFTRVTPGSRSLERGLAILRAFRHGGSALTNADLAERVGLPRPTISRLTHSLVDSGFLMFDPELRAYRLAPVLLNLALAYQEGLIEYQIALPYMQAVAKREEINVGLAAPDLCDMVYLASVRYGRGGVLRHIVPGSRRPMETLSLGLCYLNALDESSLARLLQYILPKYPGTKDAVLFRIARARQDLNMLGYCVADWHAGMIAIATTLKTPGEAIYALNISFSSSDELWAKDRIVHYGSVLMKLAEAINEAWQNYQKECPQ